MTLDFCLTSGAPPLVAILRGIRPEEVGAVGQALLQAGIRIIEVPLNSPQPLQSIGRLAADLGDAVLVGAGTVLSADAVDAVVAAGGRLIVSPNVDRAVIARALQRRTDVLPGAMSPTEALSALSAGARHVKVFPASTGGAAHLRALREVLPADCALWAVGGVNAANLAEWFRAGAAGAGIGGSLYRPGVDAPTVGARATELVAAWQRVHLSDK